jgi:hypothetical protein
MSNPFATEQAWEITTDEFLGKGDHKTKVIEADTSERSSGGYPQIVLKLANAAGASIRDWVTITDRSYGKIVQIIQALGLEPPKDDEIEVDEETGFTIPTDAYVQTWVGKDVGVVVRPQQKYGAPEGEMVDRVQGYVPVTSINASDATSAGDLVDWKDQIDQRAAGTAADDDIPF